MNNLKNKYNSIPELGYVPSLDGLRAIAVILVMLSHANFQLGANGILGVDIFFALSGFLITTLLIEEYRKYQKIHFGAFYIRRTFRLFPALYLLLISIVFYLLFIPSNAEKVYSIFTEVWASAFYVSNISWLWGWGKDGLILGHTWSLANEEQYYLFWPFIIFLFFFYKKHKILLYTIFILVFLVLIWRMTFSVNPVFSFLWADSIFIGSLFALLRCEFTSFKINQYFTFGFIVFLILIGVFPFKWYMKIYELGGRGFVGFITGFIIIGILTCRNSLLLGFMSNRIFVFFGKISYSLYLWHLPVFKIFKWHSTMPGYLTFVSKFMVTIAIAWLSYELVEKKLTKIGRFISAKYIAKTKPGFVN